MDRGRVGREGQATVFCNRSVANRFVGKRFVWRQNVTAMKTLKRALGNWVEGDRFWDREAEMELPVEYLAEGAHLLIVVATSPI